MSDLTKSRAVRTRPMQVLALGVGRTGTDSLREALQILGYDNCYHGYSLIHEHPEDAYEWNKAMDAKFKGEGRPWGRAEWDRFLGDYDAVTDLPCCLFVSYVPMRLQQCLTSLTPLNRSTKSSYSPIRTLRSYLPLLQWAFRGGSRVIYRL